MSISPSRVDVPGSSPDDVPRRLRDAWIAIAGLTAAVVGVLLTPTVVVESGWASREALVAVCATVAAVVGFAIRVSTARHPVIDLRMVGRPLVASGLAYKAASGLAVAGLSYLVTLQLQFAWGWPPALAAVGTLPQVVVLLVGGRFVGPVVRRIGLGWVVVALVLVAAGMRVVGVVAGTSVLTGLPADRTSAGAALVDTASELASGVGVAVTGTVVAALVAGSITTTHWAPARLDAFQGALTVSGLSLALVAALLVVCGLVRARADRSTPARPVPARPVPAADLESTDV